MRLILIGVFFSLCAIQSYSQAANLKGDLSDLFPFLSWAIQDAANRDVNAPIEGQNHIDGNKFIAHIMENRENWVKCVKNEACESLVNDIDDNPLVSGTKNVNIRAAWLTSMAKEYVPFASAKDRLFGIKSMLYVALQMYQEKEDPSMPWIGIEPDKFIPFLFQYAAYIQNYIMEGKTSSLIKFLRNNQKSFVVKENLKKFTPSMWQSQINFWDEEYHMMRMPCDLLEHLKKQMREKAQWIPKKIAEFIEKVKVNTDLCPIPKTE
ncbi:uncharacterized protein LOC141854587 [Brevipalpus obovatus]|uniref:uncharacterized protein LOC141854587 n=1 Tax=Brevipalpus obovatus TaxID=246614 RepID=UPI003D9DF3E8